MNKNTYELAKELKDAGFPQNNHGTGIWYDHTGGVSPHIWLSSSKDMDTSKCYYGPDLPELIEACGDGFDSLIRGGDEWHARSSQFDDKPITHGSTPEEAVARLWLALNKK